VSSRLGVLVRRHGQFDACEDAVQEALLAATRQWPADGVPENPRAWLLTVATRRLTDHFRSESARRRREEAQLALTLRAVAGLTTAEIARAFLVRAAYREAARLTSSLPERRYLEGRAAALPPPPTAS
jgi:predicted RNA polymerase sigma factor